MPWNFRQMGLKISKDLLCLQRCGIIQSGFLLSYVLVLWIFSDGHHSIWLSLTPESFILPRSRLRRRRQLHTSRAMMAAGTCKKTIFFNLFLFWERTLGFNFWRKHSILHCYFHHFYSTQKQLSIPEKSPFPGKQRMRNTIHVYNRRFLGSRFVKLHRVVSVHTINILCLITANDIS